MSNIKLQTTIAEIKEQFKDIVIKEKLDEYVSLKSKKIEIIGPNKLFDTIVKNGNYKYYYRLAELIVRHLKLKTGYQRYIHKLLNCDYDDKTIYEKIKKHGQTAKQNIYRDIIHAQILYYELYVNKFLVEHPNFKINKYLDIGCGNGNIAKLFGKRLGVNDNNVYCTELKQWHGKQRNTKDINVKNVTLVDDLDTLPYSNDSFDLITAFMVLHHTKNLDTMLNEIVRTLKKGAIFIIREHDSFTEFDYIINEIEHGLWEIIHEGVSYDDFKKDYYGKYHDWLEWDFILKKYGLKHIYANYESTSIVWNVSPTRYFDAIYIKE